MQEFDVFCKFPPSQQNAVNIFHSSWKTAFPPELNIQAGGRNFFANNIVQRVNDALDLKLRGLNVLEIGPYEGHYTYQLEKFDVGSITSIEVNVKNYLKCLVVKEVLGLRASYLLGDFMEMEEKHFGAYDFCFAGGVLYHQIAPLEMLRKMSEVADRLYIWTHCYEDVIGKNREKYPNFSSAVVEEKELLGYACPHYYRSYNWKDDAQPPAEFSGGPQSYSYWLRKQDIVNFVELLGYNRIRELIDTDDHPAGPIFAFTAERVSQ